MLKKCFKSVEGFTLIEALIAINLIGISIYLASSSITQLTKIKVNSQLYVNVNLVKRNLINVLQNNTAWVNTINGNGGEFDCLKNITGNLSDPGCEGKNDVNGYPFIVRNDADVVYYDSINSLTAGFNNDGNVCNTFDSVNGDPSCPYRATFRWRPVCDLTAGVKCHQPAIEIFGEIQIKKNKNAFNIQKSNYSFQIIRPFSNCPTQVIDFKTTSTLWSELPNAAASGIINGTALTTTDALTPPAMSFVYSTQIFSCADQVFNFHQKINIAGGYSREDANNVASVCVSDPGNANVCVFEWRQAQSTWSLWFRDWSSGVVTKLYDMPAGPIPKFDATTVFSFQLKKGLIEFYVDSELFYIFPKVWLRNYSIKVVPPPANYSNGIEPY